MSGTIPYDGERLARAARAEYIKDMPPWLKDQLDAYKGLAEAVKDFESSVAKTSMGWVITTQKVEEILQAWTKVKEAEK